LSDFIKECNQMWCLNLMFVCVGKEIQLKHRAPVVHVVVLDGVGSPLPLPGEVDAGAAPAPDLSAPHRVVICSEEQFKVRYKYEIIML
jgi:hypothetical protein